MEDKICTPPYPKTQRKSQFSVCKPAVTLDIPVLFLTAPRSQFLKLWYAYYFSPIWW